MMRPLGLKRGSTKGTFVGDTRAQVTDFYRDVVQGLKKWQPPAPQLVKDVEDDQAVEVEGDVGTDTGVQVNDLFAQPKMLELDPGEPAISA
jgi:hypothetical protein